MSRARARRAGRTIARQVGDGLERGLELGRAHPCARGPGVGPPAGVLRQDRGRLSVAGDWWSARSAPPVALPATSAATVEPSSISPDGEWQADAATVTFSLASPGRCHRGRAGARTVLSTRSRNRLAGGPVSLSWAGAATIWDDRAGRGLSRGRHDHRRQASPARRAPRSRSCAPRARRRDRSSPVSSTATVGAVAPTVAVGTHGEEAVPSARRGAHDRDRGRLAELETPAALVVVTTTRSGPVRPRSSRDRSRLLPSSGSRDRPAGRLSGAPSRGRCRGCPARSRWRRPGSPART